MVSMNATYLKLVRTLLTLVANELCKRLVVLLNLFHSYFLKKHTTYGISETVPTTRLYIKPNNGYSNIKNETLTSLRQCDKTTQCDDLIMTATVCNMISPQHPSPYLESSFEARRSQHFKSASRGRLL